MLSGFIFFLSALATKHYSFSASNIVHADLQDVGWKLNVLAGLGLACWELRKRPNCTHIRYSFADVTCTDMDAFIDELHLEVRPIPALQRQKPIPAPRRQKPTPAPRQPPFDLDQRAPHQVPPDNVRDHLGKTERMCIRLTMLDSSSRLGRWAT